MATHEAHNLILSFPGEIRNMIYRFAVLDATHGDSYGSTLVPPALARVNRQLRDEVIPIYYGETKFVITVQTTVGLDWDVFRHRCTVATRFFPLIRSLHSKFEFLGVRRDYDLMDWIMKIGERPDLLSWQGLHGYLMMTTWALYLRPSARDWNFLEDGVAKAWYSH
ncbi:hypothetical protein F5B22DRAFT_645255 [Xylaria bambusicola]|uniref:uncharacterized protein n=1 Tax=Xylaria bambusicola TaxID=326684 RepID=UPI002008E21B|nr:uncharacterized protein F5B22DRAFT_645255 [Xylaria bambusicola]KAI0518008.1 hypothetical protein F5B22DRAFT_645255 [Xylaria bambusicola]